MAEIDRSATVQWEGNLAQGTGRCSTESGVLAGAPITWQARTEQAAGHTNPEELIAGAHASCFAMSMAATLGRQDVTPQRIEVTAIVTLRPKESGGYEISRSALTARCAAPGLDDDRLAELAREAEAGCPVSNALRNNAEITLDTQAISAETG